MRQMKKLTAFLLALCLAVPALPARAENILELYGIEEETPEWAKESYYFLDSRDIPIAPYPNEPTNRATFVAQLVAVLERVVPAAELKAFPSPENGYFADYDKPGNYDTAEGRSSTEGTIYTAAGYGLTEGVIGADGLRYFNPRDKLTREQAAKMLVSLLDFFTDKLGYSLEAAGEPAVYADGDRISGWARPFTGTVAAYGLMKGDNNGNFNPQENLDIASSTVMVARTLALLDKSLKADQEDEDRSPEVGQEGEDRSPEVEQEVQGILLQSQFSHFFASSTLENFLCQPWYSRPDLFYTLSNGDGTVSLLTDGEGELTLERFDQAGTLVSTRTISKELPIFGGFLDGSDGHYYLAFGQENMEESSTMEVWRIVRYDRDWNRLDSASVTGRESYTTIPFFSTENTAMTLSARGKLTLHTARQRYLTPDDGLRHQSNITITVDTANMDVLTVSEKFPKNHVSHSFGQYARYDGETLVTVDRGDMYPRSFLLQTQGREITLMDFARRNGEIYQLTNTTGGGLEVSDSGFLFLGCSDPQEEAAGQPWNVFLTYTPKGSSSSTLTWITDGTESILRSKLVKLNKDSFVALWQQGTDVHYQKLDGKGQKVEPEGSLTGAQLPLTDPVVMDGDICWAQYSEGQRAIYLYRLEV